MPTKQSPIVPVKFDNGRWGVPLRDPSTGQVAINGSDRFNNVGNPAAQLYYTNEKNKNLVLFGNIGAELQLLKELKFNTNFGATFDWSKGYTFTPSREIWLSQNPTQEVENYPESEPVNILQQRREIVIAGIGIIILPMPKFSANTTLKLLWV